MASAWNEMIKHQQCASVSQRKLDMVLDLSHYSYFSQVWTLSKFPMLRSFLSYKNKEHVNALCLKIYIHQYLYTELYSIINNYLLTPN